MSDAPAPRPPRESATVLLLRDAAQGLEVFMVRRHLNSDFVGGAFVFPGGGLDEADCAPVLFGRYGGLSPAAAAERLGLAPERALGHYGAAIRETFEEAGVLLATQAGRPVDLGTDAARAHWLERRRALLDGELDWAGLLAAEDLTLTLDRVAYFSHWITPEGVPKRFTTRFFLAVSPGGQAAEPDRREVDEGLWVAPAEALRRHQAGELTMIFPTVKTLEALAEFGSADAAIAACAGRCVVPFLPRVVERDGEAVILLPGDAGYDEAGGRPPVRFDPSRPARS